MNNIELAQAYLKDLSGQNVEEQTRWELLKNKFSNNKMFGDELLAAIKELLMIAIVDEQLAELNYLHSYNLSKTSGKSDFDVEFEDHEEDERGHRDDLINRLRELDSDMIFTPVDQLIWINSRGIEWKEEFGFDSGRILLNRLKEEEEAVEFYRIMRRIFTWNC